jgi:DNA primase small subunit
VSNILTEQDPWRDDEKANELLNLLPDKNLNASLLKKWNSAPERSSVNKWADIDVLAESSGDKSLDAKALRESKIDVILEYTYPRLDAEVSKKLNHLLKSPFCVHPGTGRICVPIDVRKAEEFDPLAVPTVLEVLGEIDAWDAEHSSQTEADGEKKVQDWEKTSLKPYIEYFRGFVLGLLKDEKAAKRDREDGDDPMEF